MSDGCSQSRPLRPGSKNPVDAFLIKRDKTYVSDGAFVLGVLDSLTEDETRVVVILRRAIAAQCLIAPEKIQPQDASSEIGQLVTAVWSSGCIGGLIGEFVDLRFHSLVANIERQVEELTGILVTFNKRKLLAIRSFLHAHRHSDGMLFGRWTKVAAHEILQELQMFSLAL